MKAVGAFNEIDRRREAGAGQPPKPPPANSLPDPELDPPIPRPAIRRIVRRNRLIRPAPRRRHLLWRNALRDQITLHRIRARLATGDAETADGKGQPGHFDIRTYHYYVSDFKRNYLCVSGVGPGKTRHFYEPIGIYRKQGFSDPLPLARMKAFLKIIRSREAKTFLELAGDAKTYYASQGVYTLSGALKDLSTYPDGAHHQGAYQMTKAAWLAGQRPEQGALPADFQPATQDRYAVFLMEGHPGRFDKSGQPQPTALGYVRTGEIEKAVALLRNEWACLPGTSQDQGYTMAQLKADFDKYVKEFSN